MFADKAIEKLTDTVTKYELADKTTQRRVIGLLECAVKAMNEVIPLDANK